MHTATRHGLSGQCSLQKIVEATKRHIRHKNRFSANSFCAFCAFLWPMNGLALFEMELGGLLSITKMAIGAGDAFYRGVVQGAALPDDINLESTASTQTFDRT